MSSFFENRHVSHYHQSASRSVPGYEALHRMTTQLLAERVPEDGQLLVVGAGGGVELRAFASAYPEWTFSAVDPSRPMLELAMITCEPFADRIAFHHGYIDSAPDGPFDGATCLLTMHFLDQKTRIATLTHIRNRLKPGSPLVIAHISAPQSEPERSTSLRRHVVYGGTAPDNVEHATAVIGSQLTILAPDEEVSLLQASGFGDVEMFYTALSIRGWIAYAR